MHHSSPVAPSGATADEEAPPLPGDDLVPTPTGPQPGAKAIDVPPAQVCPWVAQLGYARGGWYSDFPWWTDPEGHRGRRSAAERIVPEFQQIALGDVRHSPTPPTKQVPSPVSRADVSSAARKAD
jgi:hypothetical protein